MTDGKALRADRTRLFSSKCSKIHSNQNTTCSQMQSSNCLSNRFCKRRLNRVTNGYRGCARRQLRKIAAASDLHIVHIIQGTGFLNGGEHPQQNQSKISTKALPSYPPSLRRSAV